MLGKLIYLCPSCYKEDSFILHKNSLICQNCSIELPFTSRIIQYNHKDYFFSEFYSFIRNKLNISSSESTDYLRISKKAILRQGRVKFSYKGFDNHVSTIESPVQVDQGILRFEKNRLVFMGDDKEWVFKKSELSSYTTNSRYFEFKCSGRDFFQIDFKEESPLKYEDLFSIWLGKENHLEHQPKLITKIPHAPSVVLKKENIHNPDMKERFSLLELILHLVIGLPIVCYLKWRANLRVVNKDLIPSRGPFILLMNHESYLDPIVMATVSPRRICFFTKSTTFADRILQPIFRAYRSLPNRRYETDPQVVRLALRMLKKGYGIGIFPEGERTWDGRLLPFKYNTIRFLMSVEVPIVLVKISGAFEVLPRWADKISPGNIRIEVLCSLSILPEKWAVQELKEYLENYYR